MFVRNREDPEKTARPGWAGQDAEFTVKYVESEEAVASPTGKKDY